MVVAMLARTLAEKEGVSVDNELQRQRGWRAVEVGGRGVVVRRSKR